MATPDRVSFFGQRRTLHIVLAVITFGGWLLVLLALYLWRRGRKGWSIGVASVTGLLVLLIAIGTATSPDSNKTAADTTTTQPVEQPIEETTTTETKPEKPTDPTMDKRTRTYIAQVQACQVTVGLTFLLIKRGETDSIKIADSATTAVNTCETIKSNLAVADTDHFDNQALLAWSGVSDMKSGMNALLAYLDNPVPSKVIEVRNKIQLGDAEAAQGIRQINRRRVAYGLKKIQT